MRPTALIVVAVLAIAALVASEHQVPNAGLPIVPAAAAQTDTARANMLLSPCPLTPQNLPRIIREEQA